MKKAFRYRLIHFWESTAVPLLGALGGASTARLTLRHWLPVLLVASLLSVHSQAAPLCSEVFTEERISKPLITERVAKNDFTTSRGLEDYVLELHPDFKTSLSKLTANQHWVDLGAGKATAQVQFLKSFSNNSSMPQMTAVAFKLDRWFKPSSFQGKLSVQEGAFETMPTASWKKVDLITDVYGVLSYTGDFAGALQKSVDMMNVKAELYFLALPWGYQFNKSTIQQSLPEFLNSIEGLRVEETRPGQFKITKTKESVMIPQLELVRYTDQAPPIRVFRYK
ncbi:hypothetical protein [Bdellovibrio sp. HCB274]|uniref:hypothetical protein n=1 Tax=Bdellovibrio sp. HCB274 TaxID=3394361 RepID=UPI0039B3CE23